MEQQSQAQIRRYVRNRVGELLVDDSGAIPDEVAVYILSDPRNLRLARYVGQSCDPYRRYLQHINQAKLWLMDETAWWIKSPRLRPLSEWIRTLYGEERRLPAMMIVGWTDKYDALRLERRHIHQCMDADLPLLNRESEKIIRQPKGFRTKTIAQRIS